MALGVTARWYDEMKIFAPKYYKDFKCIADKCKHSCCVGWEIDIDEDALEIYREMPGEIGESIRESITESDGVACFKLDHNERCPHLDERGLCRIIKAVGEDYLCDICREHPRFYNEVGDHTEVGVGAVCEEAARLILETEDYATLEEVDELYGDAEDIAEGFDASIYRADLFDMISKKEKSYESRIDEICRKYSLIIPDDERIGELFASLEYLDESHRHLFASFSSNVSIDDDISHLRERFFAYLVYRHGSGAGNDNEFRASVFFAIVLDRLFAFLIAKFALSPIDSARIISEELEYSEDNTAAIQNIA